MATRQMDTLVTIYMGVFGVCLFGVMCFFVLDCYNSRKLYIYLKKTKYDRWCDLTTWGDLGPGVNNASKGISYMFNKLDNDDDFIRDQKMRIRFAFKMWLLMAVITFVYFAVGGYILLHIQSK